MNLEDETLLTAYLDGELTPRELQLVEEALRTDPSLAQRLSELARVRELVAGLPHPLPPFDLSATIVPQLSATPARLPLVPRLRAWRGSYWEVALCAAAVVLATGSIGYLALLREMHAPARPAGGGPVALLPAAKSPTPPVRLEPPKLRPRPRSVVRKAPRTNSGDVDTPLAAQEQDRFQAMIDSPNLKTMFFVVDSVGGQADQRVGELVDALPRADAMYACLTIVPDVVVDPKHPGRAKVFAVALTDPELRQVREKLNETFPHAVEESTPDPSVVTQLAEVSRVSLFPGTAVADLESAAESERRIQSLKGQDDGGSDDHVAEPEPESGPTREQFHSAPSHYADNRQRGVGSRFAAVRATEPTRRGKSTIVLIWVASR